MLETNGNGNYAIPRGVAGGSGRPLEIRLAEPLVLPSHTPEQVEAVIRLIETQTTPNHVLLDLSPELGERLLQLQYSHQRDFSERTVQQLAEDMLGAAFSYTGDSIKFAVGAIGIDGQHRCRAVVVSRVTIRVLLVIGLPINAIEKMDIGRPRSTADIHETRGADSVTPTISMTTAIALEASNFHRGTANRMSKSRRVSTDDKLSQDQLDFVVGISNALHVGGIRTSGAVAGALRAYRENQTLELRQFLMATFSNQASEMGFHPTLSSALYNYLNTAKGAKGSGQITTYNQAVAVLKTARQWAKGSGTVSLKSATQNEINQLAG